MRNRIKEIRDSLGLTLEAFGSRIGVTRSAISNIENGRREPTNQLVSSICREFHVNEEWLRTGLGEPFPSMTRTQQISSYVDALMSDSPDSLRSIVVSYLMKWDVEDWEAVAKILKKHGAPQIPSKEEGPAD